MRFRNCQLALLVLTLTALSLPKAAGAATCPIDLKVTNLRQAIILDCPNCRQSPDIMLERIGSLSEGDACDPFRAAAQFLLNNPEEKIASALPIQVGDVLQVQLFNKKPSPYGKFLRPEYHYGLSLHAIKREGNMVKQFSPALSFDGVGVFKKS